MSAGKYTFNENIFWKRITDKRKKLPKNMEMIRDFARLFRGKVVMGGKKGYLKYLNPLRELVNEANHVRNVSLWEQENGKEIIRNIAVEGEKGIRFEAEPSYVIEISKTKNQYIWCLNGALNTDMAESVYCLTKVICYLHPDVKSMHTKEKAYIRVPGIPCVTQSFTPSFYKVSGKRYSMNQLWDAFGGKLPVRGKSIKRFLRSEKIYKPGLKTTHEFLCLNRLNVVLSLRYEKTEFAERRQSILFLIWNFALGIGMQRDEVIDLIRKFTKRQGYACTDQDILDAEPVMSYRFTNEKLMEYLGDKAKKYFGTEKRAEKKREKPKVSLRHKNDHLIWAISILASQGIKIWEMAEIFGEHISKVKRLRSRAVKLGWIVKPI